MSPRWHRVAKIPPVRQPAAGTSFRAVASVGQAFEYTRRGSISTAVRPSAAITWS
jgi:hypothetical protein